jgi:hypothetical protein
VAFFADLPGRWEIKCSGGEVFAHPGFVEQVVSGLMQRTPHHLSILSNFSASSRQLMELARMTRGRLEVFSASLHLEYVAPDAFVRKAAWFRDQLDPATRFVVNQVVLPGRETEAAACRDLCWQHDLRWFAQLYKVDGGVADYPDPGALEAVVGAAPGPREANRAPSYRGHRCWAGVDYFVVDQHGEAWACRTAKRHGEGGLGNILRGAVTRLAAPTACRYDICPCTVPVNRGMVEGIAAAPNRGEARDG